jgi:hypothetical protein
MKRYIDLSVTVDDTTLRPPSTGAHSDSPLPVFTDGEGAPARFVAMGG